MRHRGDEFCAKRLRRREPGATPHARKTDAGSRGSVGRAHAAAHSVRRTHPVPPDFAPAAPPPGGAPRVSFLPPGAIKGAMVAAVVEVRPEVDGRFARTAAGDGSAWGSLLTEHDERLRRMVAFRMDPRLRGRVDAADVVQEAYLEAADHRDDYFRQAEAVPVFLWLRGVVANKLLETAPPPPRHRHARRRPRGAAAPAARARRHVSGDGRAIRRPRRGPGDGGGGAEVEARCGRRWRRMDPIDREVLALRHFEQLTNSEAGAGPGHPGTAAAKRYVRALKRLERHAGRHARGPDGAAAMSDRFAAQPVPSPTADRAASDRRAAGRAGGRLRCPLPPRRTPGRRRICRRASRPGRRDPRVVPGHDR